VHRRRVTNNQDGPITLWQHAASVTASARGLFNVGSVLDQAQGLSHVIRRLQPTGHLCLMFASASRT
jgi:hypothetical protein